MSGPMTRRDLIARIAPGVAIGGALAGSLATLGTAMGADSAPATGPSPVLASGFKDGEYVLPPLPYAYDALEPYIDAETMKLHHDKHHKGYVEGLNKTLKSLAEIRMAGKEMNVSALSGLEEDLSFNAAGHILHTTFWTSMAPQAGGEPSGAIAEEINKFFGSVEAFKTQFSKAAGAVKGSGWAVLAYEPMGDGLMILQLKQHDLQLAPGAVPLLPLDVWEHAYYLKYHNVRPEYIKAWWNVVNWPAVEAAMVWARQMNGQT
jgi:superoxide dismutase, Fe-Mn family